MGLVAVLAVAAWARSPALAAAHRPIAEQVNIRFDVEGDGRADFAGVWTETERIRFVPSRSSRMYDGAIAAVLTVHPDPGGKGVWCRIYVDGVKVAEQDIRFFGSASCVWVRGTETLPGVTAPD